MCRVTGMQFVFAAAGMCVDEQQALVLAGEGPQDFEQQDMFVDVGEIPGVILMAIFHGTQDFLEPWRESGVVYTDWREQKCGKAYCWIGNSWRPATRRRPISGGEPPLPTRPAAGQPVRIAPPLEFRRCPRPHRAPAGEPVTIASLPKEVRRAVVADAARRFQVAASAVVLTRAEQVTWPDGSLGCPEAGRLYTQALVPGYRLVAKTLEGDLAYHADSNGNLAACGDAHAAIGSREDLKKVRPVEPVTGPPTVKPDR